MENWKIVRLGDVCEILNGYAFKSDKYVDSGIRVIRITNVQKGFIEDNSPAFYPITEKENLKDYELYENDLLISLTGNVGRVALLSKEMLPAALNQRVGCIRIRDKNLLISYLFTFLNSDKFESDCIYSARGIAQKNMSTEWLKNYLIPLPPIEVQIKIANNLNTCAKIIKIHNKQLNNFDLLIKSRFIEMFGDNPIENGKWKVEKLGNLGLCKNGMNFSYEDNGFEINCLGVGDFKDNAVISNCEKLPVISLNEKPSEEYLLKDNDIVFVRSNGNKELVGRSVLVHPRVLTTFSGFCIRFRLSTDSINHLFLLQFLKMPNTRKNMAGRGANIQNLNQQILSNLDIPVPPIELQNDFAAFVQQIDKSKFEIWRYLKFSDIMNKIGFRFYD